MSRHVDSPEGVMLHSELLPLHYLSINISITKAYLQPLPTKSRNQSHQTHMQPIFVSFMPQLSQADLALNIGINIVFNIIPIINLSHMSEVAASAPKSKKIAKAGPGRQVRLWVRAKFLSFRRSKVAQNTNQTILRLQGVNDRSAASYYFGKRVAYIYKTHSGKAENRFRTIWGRISTTHGNTGAVLARFATNLPARAIGSTLRVMLFPQRG